MHVKLEQVLFSGFIMSYIPRLMESDVQTFASVMRVVMIGGPRQCGKTTLLRHFLSKTEPLLSSGRLHESFLDNILGFE